MCLCVDLEGAHVRVLGRVWRAWGSPAGARGHSPPPHPQGTPADVLYKGTITRIIGEDSPSRLDRSREDGLPKGHVIYEGKKGHVLSYEGESRRPSRLPGAGGRAGAGPALPSSGIFDAREGPSR